MKKTIIGLTALALLALPSATFADSGQGCQQVYGGQCVSTNLILKKTVKNPVTGEYTDILGSNAPHYLPSQTVPFRIHIQNTGNTDLNNIQVMDKFPDFLDFKDGPGKFDTTKGILNFTVDSLKQGEFRDIDITGVVRSGSNPGVTCLSNFAQATAGDQTPSGTAVFCIENQIMAPVQELPKTGPTSTLLILLGSIITLVTSAFFYKKARV